MSSRAARILASVIISLAFLVFAVRNVDWQEAVAALAAARYGYVPAILGVSVWSLYIRAQRWRVLLSPVGVPPMRPLVTATYIGFMANMVLPLRAGEVIRPVLASRRTDLPLGAVLATILLERIFDMCAILLLFGVSALAVPVSPRVRDLGWIFTAVAVVGLGGAALVRWQAEFALGVLRRVTASLPGGPAIQAFGAGFVKALDILRSPGAFLRVFAWSIYLWLVISLINALALLAFGLPLAASLVLTSVVAIAVSVPSAPGYIGNFQYGCVLALALFAVSESTAVAFSIFLHLTQFAALIGAGLWALWAEGLSFRQVESAAAT